MKCKLEKQYFLDPELVSQRLDELHDVLSIDGDITPNVSFYIGYFKAQIERDIEEYSVAVEDKNEEE